MSEFFKRITKSDIRNILSISIILGCFVLLYFMMIRDIPPTNKDIVNFASGSVFGAGFVGVVNYFFGSSKNESDAANNNKSNNSSES